MPDGTTLYYPPGTYAHADEVTLSGKTNVTLELAPGAVIKQLTAGKKGIVVSGGGQISIVGGSFVGPGTAPESAVSSASEVGIRVSSGSRAVIRDVDVSGFGYRGIWSSAARTRVLDCDVASAEPTTSISPSVGILVDGGTAMVRGCHAQGYSVGISAGTQHPQHPGRQRGRGARSLLAGSTSACTSNARSTRSWRTTASLAASRSRTRPDQSVVSGNVVLDGPLWHTSGVGGSVSGNTVLRGPLSLGSRQLQRLWQRRRRRLALVRRVRYSGNVIRQAPYITNGSGLNPTGLPLPLGAISGTAKDCVFEGNLIEYAAGCGIRLYDEQGLACTGNQILNNTFRKSSTNSNGDAAAIALGSSTFGVGTGEDVSGTRIIGNTVESTVAATVAGCTTTSGSTVVAMGGADDAAKKLNLQLFRAGDLVTSSGTPFTAGTVVDHIELFCALPGGGVGAAVILNTVAPASESITLTRRAIQVSYDVDASLAKAGSAIEVWGNEWGTPVFNQVFSLGSPPTTAVRGPTPIPALMIGAASGNTNLSTTYQNAAGAAVTLVAGWWVVSAVVDFVAAASGDTRRHVPRRRSCSASRPATSPRARPWRRCGSPAANAGGTVSQQWVVQVTAPQSTLQLQVKKDIGTGASQAIGTTTNLTARPL